MNRGSSNELRIIPLRIPYECDSWSIAAVFEGVIRLRILRTIHVFVRCIRTKAECCGGVTIVLVLILTFREINWAAAGIVAHVWTGFTSLESTGSALDAAAWPRDRCPTEHISKKPKHRAEQSQANTHTEFSSHCCSSFAIVTPE